MPVVGRERDLAILARQYREVGETGTGRLVSVRGRRRVGKSTLIDEFLRRAEAPHVFFAASRQGLAHELELFLEELTGSTLPAGKMVREGLAPSSWEATLNLLAQTADAEHPAVVVVDEFPWLVERDESIEATIQKAWDRKLEAVPLLLVLVGCDLAMMEGLTTYGRPLYGRPTREMVIDPLTPAEIGDLLGVGSAEAIDAYVTIGGFPQLALRWPSGASREAFLREMLEDPQSPLIVNGERSIAAEFPPQTRARRVFSAIGAGEAAFNRISARAEISASQLTPVLAELTAKRTIERLVPYASGPASKAKRYVVADPYLRFWLRFVEPSLELVERGRGALVAERIEARWADYRGRAVEPIVRRSLERLVPDERLGESQHITGYWTRDQRIEVDLVGAHAEHDPRRAAAVGSIKWREREPFGRRDARALQDARLRVPGADAETLLVGVSRRGFADGLGLDAEFGPDDLVGAWRSAR